MNASPPYLRVGPVVIHLYSRESSFKPTLPSSGFSSVEPTLDVQGSVFLSPDDGMLIQELNGVVSSFLLYQRRISYEDGDQVSSNASGAPSPTVLPSVPSSSPLPPPVASTPSPSIPSSVSNPNYVCALKRL